MEISGLELAPAAVKMEPPPLKEEDLPITDANEMSNFEVKMEPWAKDTDEMGGVEVKVEPWTEGRECEPESVGVHGESMASSYLPETFTEIRTEFISDNNDALDMVKEQLPLPHVPCEVEIVTSGPKGDEKKKGHKKHCCIFCSKFFIKMRRHFINKHAEEEEVIELMKSDSAASKVLLRELVRLGDFQNNVSTATGEKDQSILSRNRPVEEAINYDDYVPCNGCARMYQKSVLHAHVKECEVLVPSTSFDRANEGGGCDQESKLKAPVFDRYYDPRFLCDIIGEMVDDDVTRIATNDNLIMQFASCIFGKNFFSVSESQDMRQDIRCLGRLVLYFQKVSPGDYLDNAISPEKFETLVAVVKDMCQERKMLNKKSPIEKPSLPMKLRRLLTKCAIFKRDKACRLGDRFAKAECTDFIKLLNSDFDDCVAGITRSTLPKEKKQYKELLPLTEDVEMLVSFIDREIDLLHEDLEETWSPSAFVNLNHYLLAKIIIFNKRRSSDVGSMLLRQYEASEVLDAYKHSSEFLEALSRLEVSDFHNLNLVYVEGNRGRLVPIFLTSRMICSMRLLRAMREEIGIPRENPYFFARTFFSSFDHIRGSDALRAVVRKCPGLRSSNLLGRTHLERYLGREFSWVLVNSDEMAELGLAILAAKAGVMGELHTLEDLGVDSSCDEDIGEDWNMEDGPLSPLSESYIDKPFVDGWLPSQSSMKVEEGKSSKSTTRKWRTSEKVVILKFFDGLIKEKREPQKEECQSCIKKNCRVLADRRWHEIKNFVHDYIEKMKGPLS